MKRPDLAQRNRRQHKGSFLHEDAAWMRDAYLERKLSLRQMAAEAECGVRTIARWMTIHGIETRSMSEGKRLNPITGERHQHWSGGPPRCGCGKPMSRKRTVSTCMECRSIRWRGEGNPKWRGDAIDYPAAHDRVKAARGLATSHSCLHCGGAAAHWAYDNGDPDEKSDPDNGPYSLDILRYLPLCVRCHKLFDMACLRASKNR